MQKIGVIFTLTLLTITLSVSSMLVSATEIVDEQFHFQEVVTPFFYLGAKAGWMHYQNACEEWNISCDGDDKAYGLFGGYQFSEHFAFETAYLDLGEAVAVYSESGLNNSYVGSMKGIELSMLARLPMSDDVDFFAKVGAFRWDGDNQGPVDHTSDSDWAPIAGVGLEYAFSRSWTARLEYQYIDKLGSELIGGSNGHLTTLGLSYRFGQSETSVKPKQQPVTLPVVIEAEVVVLAPVVLPAISITTLFDFDSSQLNNPQALLPVIERLQSAPNAIAQIKGYTDSKGAAAYNQALSERRVQSVLDYLLANGVVAEQLELQAYGEHFPEMDNKTESHRHANRRVSIVISPSTTDAE
ncbi:outer membrane beta-barrel protein [Shewanella sp. D64]|uniref:outer membrane beta-barrel protein n=1 Tax=unclassified Shewanella TaxID=196818 RepID=UPI0022BA4898|nr:MULTISPECIES: outer membrane beta-barrel protein [unclassified Shewanella]MEC4727343.1 outer membrane beta-barrel protein [Shewanella sp. D64]MEC4739498.1 outer membrane beta-barrel protein [Shewanella sp. E94]WBJ96825.1 outer membrane beta-barrel protein [Shewanella sp. MTB7]